MRDPMAFDDEPPTLRPSSVSGGFSATSASRPFLFAVAAAALLGALFAAVSTHDFISHLDRQMHTIHCSFIPGAGSVTGESGCRTVMMSPYSSLFRTSMWGGLPISLLAFAVFAYLVYRALDFALRDQVTRRETLFLVAATVLPALMSLIYGIISTVKLDAVCKLCVGVYVSSAACLVLAILAHTKATEARDLERPMGLWLRWFAEGCGYVLVLVVVYVLMAPVSAKTTEGCGTLAKSDDPNGIIIPIGGRTNGVSSIAVLDPLCPACKAFDERLSASGLDEELNLRAVLFPLDSACNWMVKESLHPGACAVSEAMLCDKTGASKIMAWAFEHQEELRAAAEKNDAGVRSKITAQFPQVKGCLGSVGIKNKLNKSLRWAVANALPVLTPQLFVEERRVCDEDTDLGLEYTVTAMLEHRGAKGGK